MIIKAPKQKLLSTVRGMEAFIESSTIDLGIHKVGRGGGATAIAWVYRVDRISVTQEQR